MLIIYKNIKVRKNKGIKTPKAKTLFCFEKDDRTSLFLELLVYSVWETHLKSR